MDKAVVDYRREIKIEVEPRIAEFRSDEANLRVIELLSCRTSIRGL